MSDIVTEDVGHIVHCPGTVIYCLISKMSNKTEEMSNINLQSVGPNVQCKRKFLVYTDVLDGPYTNRYNNLTILIMILKKRRGYTQPVPVSLILRN